MTDEHPAPTPYGHIADLYDYFVQPERVNYDIPFFIQEARKAQGEVLELMAGTGRVSLPLIESGVHLTCVDASDEMLGVLRDKLAQRAGSGLQANLVKMDIRALDLGKRFNLILIPFQSFLEITSPFDQRITLTRIRDHLADQGHFICTMHNPAVRLKSVDGKYGLWGKRSLPKGGTLLVWGLQEHDAAQHIISGMQFYEEYDAQGVMRARRLLNFSFQLLSKALFEQLIAPLGFRVLAMYGDYDGSQYAPENSPYMIWILEKAWQQRKTGPLRFGV